MSVNVRSIVKQYLSHAKGYYRIARAGGGSEVANLKHALRPFSRMFGRLLVEELAVRHLRAYRDGLARKKLCRTTINARVHRVRRCFRWAEEYELITPGLWARLKTLSPLKPFRSDATEPVPVEPATWEQLAAALPYLTVPLRGLVLFMWNTGARCDEACQLRLSGIDRRGRIHIYTPARHKSQHLGKTRRIYLDAEAQRSLNPHLRVDGGYLFQPVEADRSPSTKDTYDTHAVRRAIARACAKAGVECFAPHSIRHAYATRMAAKYGLQITTFLLGHSRTDTTMIYAHVEEARVLAALGI